jgi:hypothetical protein
MSNTPRNQPIDAVITWVDGNDPAHQAKLQAYLGTQGQNPPGSAHPTRFRETGELEYCVASILRFAPWVRNIHILTDDQIPSFLEDGLHKNIAQHINLVSHKTVFRGYEWALPVFSCRPIETLLWRIPGLAERFIYFNDDMMLIRPVQPEAFFENDKLVIRGKWTRFADHSWLGKLKAFLLALKHQQTKRPIRASHRRMQELSARFIGCSQRYLLLPHEPHPAFKSDMDQLYSDHPQWLENNIKHKLRHPDQSWSFSLAAHQAIRNNNAVIDNQPTHSLIKAGHHSAKRIQWQLQRLERKPLTASICIQSLDLASADMQQRITRWLQNQIGGLPRD